MIEKSNPVELRHSLENLDYLNEIGRDITLLMHKLDARFYEIKKDVEDLKKKLSNKMIQLNFEESELIDRIAGKDDKDRDSV